MTTDFRALCAELLAELENAIRVIYREDGTRHISSADPVITKADIALAQPAQPEEGMLMDEELWKIWKENDGLIPTILRLAIAADRARRPAPEPPAEGELGELVKWLRLNAEEYARDGCPNSADHFTRAADLLQQRHPAPVPVSERLPGPEDCIPHPRTKRGKWCWGFERCEVSLARPARWRLMHMETIEMEASHWCEATALPLPAGEVE